MVEDQQDHQKSELCGPVLGEGQLWIKLKLPIPEEESNIHENLRDKKVCHFCNKEFSSGKALGGHMRIHVQHTKGSCFRRKLIKPHKSIKFKKHYSRDQEERVFGFVKRQSVYAGDDHGKQPSCKVCGKDFPSMKSLFGHMRCHPEREWRGIQPPAMEKSYSSSLSEADQSKESDDQTDSMACSDGTGTVDLVKSLPGWSVTAKRGQKAVANNLDFSSSEEGDQFLDAANDLMMLASLNGQKLEELEGTNSNSLTSKGENEIGIGQVSEEEDKQIEESKLELVGYEKQIEESELMLLGNDEQKNGIILEKIVGKCEGKERTEEYGKLKESAKQDQSNDRNTEKQCDRILSVKNDRKVMIKNKRRRKKMKLSDLDMVQNALPMTPIQPGPKMYRCSTCDKSFANPQALGGHRSSHKKLKPVMHSSFDESGNVSSPHIAQLDENEVSGPSNTCRRVLDFDLNEMPPMEDGAGIVSDIGDYNEQAEKGYMHIPISSLYLH